MSEELEEVYGMLEPVRYSHLETSSFTGVLLYEKDCVKVVKELARLEFQVNKVEALQKEVKQLKQEKEELENQISSAYRFCSHCNKEYKLVMSVYSTETLHNFSNCTHCGKRNDVWVSMKKNIYKKRMP